MSYAILDVNVNKVVETTTHEFGALEYVKKMFPRAMSLPLVTKSELLGEAQYRMGNYIIIDGMTCELVEKKMVVDPGMIYNSRIPGIVPIGIWKTIPIADNLLKAARAQVQSHNNPDNVRVIDTGFGTSNESKIKEVIDKTKPPHSVYVLPPVQPAKQLLPVRVQPPPVQPPPQVVQVSRPPVPLQPIHQILPKVPALSLDQLARNPMIFSIGNGTVGQKEKIEQILHHEIATGLISDENIIVISNGNAKNTEAWAKSFSQGLVYETLDNDILQYLIMSLSAPTQQKRPMGTFRNVVVFDHCLTRTHIDKKFLQFLDSIKINQVKVIIMTEDKDLIRSDLSKKFDYMFIHSFNYTMNMTHNEIQEFVKKHDFLKSATMIESDMMECFKGKNCIAFDVTKPNKMFQF